MSQSLFEPFHPLAAIATTPQTAKLLSPLCQTVDITLWLPESVALPNDKARHYQGPLKDWLSQAWHTHQGLIFCLATGAVVRLISPFLCDKAHDPAIIVVDATGNYVISLCGGHQGGADRLTQAIATQLDSTPILTGAASGLMLPGIDILGQPFGWIKGEGDWTGVSAAIARQETVQVIQDSGTQLWQKNLPQQHPFIFDSNPSPSPAAIVRISHRLIAAQPANNIPEVQWHPRVLWLGIGCTRGAPLELIEDSVNCILKKYQLASAAIAAVATIELKQDEVGLLAFCQKWQLPLKTFSASRLSSISVPNPSLIVEQEVGTPSVAEASALAALPDDTAQSLIVDKQVFKSETAAVTIAVSLSEKEETKRNGKLWLVGIGPGDLRQITPAAKTAIIQADAIVGYSMYLELIQPLLRPGQIVEAMAITQERQRAERAIELAQWGLSVAVISSGDCGIYAMGGLVLEKLQANGWDGITPTIEVFPGITAAVAAAARVGTPLMHDFCTISLSDLLTPRPVIEKRIEMAAMGDFVTALYNPRSEKRITLIEEAQAVFLQHRIPDTPVALVRSAYREEEAITLTTLAKMLTYPIDMLTVVIIGNRSTRQYEDWLITPRGYQ